MLEKSGQRLPSSGSMSHFSAAAAATRSSTSRNAPTTTTTTRSSSAVPQCLLLALVVATSALPRAAAQVPFVSKCPGEYCFLQTHGGFSYYRVRMDPSKWPAGQLQKVTDEVIYTTCFAASGQPPPCMGKSSLCTFFSNSLCQAASETGCEQPMLSTSVQMGCSSPLDPLCKDRILGNDPTAALWASMGGNWAGGSCGRLGTPEHEAVFCSSGNEFSVDGEWWTNCDMATPACASAMGGTRTLQHYAFCVGRKVCQCVHGECDITSDNGFCLPGSCAPGFFGQNCNYQCTSAFCNGRNDPTAPNGGVYVNSLNQCVCTCLPQWGPGGTEGCYKCTLPGSHECVAYTADVLATTTRITTAQRGVDIQLDIEARFQNNDQVDPNINTDLQVELSSGGGGGDGRPLTVLPNPVRMTAGRASVRVTFGSACAACVLIVRDLDTSNPSMTYRIKQLVMPPIQVLSNGVRMRAVTTPGAVSGGVPFAVSLQVVDSAGVVDRTASNLVRAALSDPANTGTVLQAAAGSSLDQRFVSGDATWRLTLSQPCPTCRILFSDASPVRTLADLTYGPLTGGSGGGTATRLFAAQEPPALVNRGQAFTVIIDAVGVSGSRDGTVQGNTIGLALAGSNGAVLVERGGGTLRRQMVGGRVQFTLELTAACVQCVIVATDAASGGLGSVSLRPVTVSALAVMLRVTNPVVTSVRVGDQFTLSVSAVDAQGFADSTDASRVRLTVVDGGGNGGGGELQAHDGLLTRTLLRGNTTAVLSFTRACDACVIRITDIDDPVLQAVQSTAIRVRTTAVQLGSIAYYARQVKAGTLFDIRIGAVDANGGIDRSQTGTVDVTLVPGGGNGDGGALTSSLPTTLVRLVDGEAVFSLRFTEACTACVLQFRHNNPSFPLLSLSPIKVTTTAVRLRFANAPPVRVAPAELFSVAVEAVDAAGNRDDSERGAVRMKAVSGGANGNGGDLLNDLSASNLAVKPTAGLASFRPSFTQACAGCRLQFTDTDTTLDSLTSEPIMITGVGVRLGLSAPAWARVESSGVAATIPVKSTLPVTVQVLDSEGFVATGETGSVTVSLKPGGGNGDGGVLRDVSGRGLTQPVNEGSVTFNLQFERACSGCVLNFVGRTGVAATNSPAFQVVGEGVQMTSDTANRVSLPKETTFPLVIKVVDDAGSVAEGWAEQVSVRLLPGGGNGDGGVLSASGAASLTQRFEKGVRTFQIGFTKACNACFLEVSDATGRFAKLTVGPFQVTTTTEALRATLRGGQPATQNAPFIVDVKAVDADGNVNVLDTSLVTASLKQQNGAAAVPGTLASALSVDSEQSTGAGVSRRMKAGETALSLVLRNPCAACTVSVASDSPGGVISAAVPTDGSVANPPAVQQPGGASDDGGGLSALWIVAIIALVLIFLCCVALGLALAYWKLGMGKKTGGGADGTDAAKQAPSTDDAAKDAPHDGEGEAKPVDSFDDYNYDYDYKPDGRGGGGAFDPDLMDGGEEPPRANPLDSMFQPRQPVSPVNRNPSWMVDPAEMYAPGNGGPAESPSYGGSVGGAGGQISPTPPDLDGFQDAQPQQPMGADAPIPPPSHFHAGEI